MKFRLSIVNKILILILAVHGVTFAGIYLFFIQEQTADLNRRMLTQAHHLYQQVVISRQWSAHYGGVYVEKRPGVETNPFLLQAGPGPIRPEITDTAGRVYTLRNPSTITRELSELTARKKGAIRFRVSSLKPLNPANLADDFESRALQRFAQGEAEVFGRVEEQGKQLFRYCAPLFVAESCLTCHGIQGYQVGDIRGTISLQFPMEVELGLLAARQRFFLNGGLLLIFLVCVALILCSRTLITRPIAVLGNFARKALDENQELPAKILARNDEVGDLAKGLSAAGREIASYRLGLEQLVAQRTRELEATREKLEEISRTDPLTGVNNRRHLQIEAPKLLALFHRQGRETSLMMLDVDHFKDFNDRYGHPAGDLALVHIADILRQMTRSYDLVVRYGGEEFLLLLPDQGAEEGLKVAERIRHTIERSPVLLEEGKLPVQITVSIGLYAERELSDLDYAIRLADQALYRAKTAGRNRAILFPTGDNQT